MKDKLIRFEAFSFYDMTGICRHLRSMSKKGWILESAGLYFYTYRRIKPKSLCFSAVYSGMKDWEKAEFNLGEA